MNLVLKLDLDIVVTHSHTKYEINRSSCSKVIVWKQTDTQTCVKSLPIPLTFNFSQSLSNGLALFRTPKTYREKRSQYSVE